MWEGQEEGIEPSTLVHQYIGVVSSTTFGLVCYFGEVVIVFFIVSHRLHVCKSDSLCVWCVGMCVCGACVVCGWVHACVCVWCVCMCVVCVHVCVVWVCMCGGVWLVVSRFGPHNVNCFLKLHLSALHNVR